MTWHECEPHLYIVCLFVFVTFGSAHYQYSGSAEGAEVTLFRSACVCMCVRCKSYLRKLWSVFAVLETHGLHVEGYCQSQCHSGLS